MSLDFYDCDTALDVNVFWGAAYSLLEDAPFTRSHKVKPLTFSYVKCIIDKDADYTRINTSHAILFM